MKSVESKMSGSNAPRRAAKRVRIEITRSESGLYVASSEDVKGLLISHRDRAAIEADIPNVLRVLLKRRYNQDVIVLRLEDDDDPNLEDWVSIPAHIASEALAEHKG
jgi:hypothetical protein